MHACSQSPSVWLLLQIASTRPLQSSCATSLKLQILCRCGWDCCADLVPLRQSQSACMASFLPRPSIRAAVIAGNRSPSHGGAPKTPDPDPLFTSSVMQREPNPDANGGYTSSNQEGILWQKYHDSNGRCVAIFISTVSRSLVDVTILTEGQRAREGQQGTAMVP